MVCHNIQHRIRCIMSYQKAVECFSQCAFVWPALFDGFSIELTPQPKNGSQRVDGKFVKPDELMDCVFGSTDRKLISGKIGSKFPRLRKELRKQSGTRCLHSEIALWLNIRSRGKAFVQFSQVPKPTTPEKRKVIIGVSKPTCLLCSWYFEELSSLVLIRSTSHNVYVRWKAPPSQSEQNDDAIMNTITQKLKQTAKSVIKRGWAYRLDQDSAGGTPPAHRQTFFVDDERESSERSSEDSVSIVTSESSFASSERTEVTNCLGMDMAD